MSNLYDFATGNDFGIAVARHLGLYPDRVLAAKVDSALNTPLSITVTYSISRTDLVSIAGLMDPIASEVPAEPEHPLRAEWDSMMDHQRQHFGTFENYCARQAKLQAPDDKPLVVKWVYGCHLTKDQKANNMGYYDGKFAMNVDDLTDAQRALP